MAKTYRPYCPDQMFLLPPSLRDWLPENHLVYFVSDVVDREYGIREYGNTGTGYAFTEYGIRGQATLSPEKAFLTERMSDRIGIW